jgi:hypothetical protein
MRAGMVSIPRGAKKDLKPYWTQKMQDLEEQVTVKRVNAIYAQYRKTLNTSVRGSWVKKTESLLNLDLETCKSLKQ